jgi:hypothetical protein
MNEGAPFGGHGNIIWDARRGILKTPQTPDLTAFTLALDATGAEPTQLTIKQSDLQGTINMVEARDITGNFVWKIAPDGTTFDVFCPDFRVWRQGTGKFGSIGYHPTNDYAIIGAFDANAGVLKPIVIGQNGANCRVMLHGDTDDGVTDVQIFGAAKITSTLSVGAAITAAGNVSGGGTDMAALLALTSSLQAQINTANANISSLSSALAGKANTGSYTTGAPSAGTAHTHSVSI